MCRTAGRHNFLDTAEENVLDNYFFNHFQNALRIPQPFHWASYS